MKLAVAVVVLAGCRFNFFEHDPGDTHGIDAPPGDAIGLGAFGNIHPVSEINSATHQEDDPSLTEDMLEIYFDSSMQVVGGDNGDVWVARRASVADPFSAPASVPELANLADDTTFDLSPDGLTMYFASDRLSGGNRDIFVTTRADRQAMWSTPVQISELASPADDSGVCQSADGLTLIFSSARTGTGHLYLTTRATLTSPWSPPTLITELMTPTEENQQWCNRDLTVIYFTHVEVAQDIWMSTRASPSDPWNPPQPVPELNTDAEDEADPWLSPDLRTIYFFRSSVATNGDIYMATR